MTDSGPVPSDVLRSASTSEIAVLLLKTFTGSVHPASVMALARDEYSGEPDAGLLVGRLSDAYAWLESRGCLGPTTDSAGWRRVTQAGRELLEAGGLTTLYASERLQGNLLPKLERSARPNFDRGDYETASFAAMKEVEVEVRRLSGLPAGLLGTKLMQEALRIGGPLADPNAEAGEQVALVELFKGAIGSFKNPPSHRAVEFDDPMEAAEVVQFADLLLRILRRIERRLAAAEE